jgi:superfamily II DNA or RNA helicase
MIKLRPYQETAIQQARELIIAGKKRFVFCSPTGSGKTFTFASIVNAAIQRGKRVLILTHRVELLTQAGGALEGLGLNPTKSEAGKLRTTKQAKRIEKKRTRQRTLKKYCEGRAGR